MNFLASLIVILIVLYIIFYSAYLLFNILNKSDYNYYNYASFKTFKKVFYNLFYNNDLKLENKDISVYKKDECKKLIYVTFMNIEVEKDKLMILYPISYIKFLIWILKFSKLHSHKRTKGIKKNNLWES